MGDLAKHLDFTLRTFHPSHSQRPMPWSVAGQLLATPQPLVLPAHGQARPSVQKLLCAPGLPELGRSTLPNHPLHSPQKWVIFSSSRTRTQDLALAGEALALLSYIPGPKWVI